jgi:hypothetical protein
MLHEIDWCDRNEADAVIERRIPAGKVSNRVHILTHGREQKLSGCGMNCALGF